MRYTLVPTDLLDQVLRSTGTSGSALDDARLALASALDDLSAVEDALGDLLDASCREARAVRQVLREYEDASSENQPVLDHRILPTFRQGLAEDLRVGDRLVRQMHNDIVTVRRITPLVPAVSGLPILRISFAEISDTVTVDPKDWVTTLDPNATLERNGS